MMDVDPSVALVLRLAAMIIQLERDLEEKEHRVTELLIANTREVERRRAAEEALRARRQPKPEQSAQSEQKSALENC